MSEKCKCELCDKTYADRGALWKHKNAKKTSCMSRERTVELLLRTETLEIENAKLKLQICDQNPTDVQKQTVKLVQENDELKTSNNVLTAKLEQTTKLLCKYQHKKTSFVSPPMIKQ